MIWGEASGVGKMRRIMIASALLLGGCTKMGVQAPLSAEAPKLRQYDEQKLRLVKVLEVSYTACLPTDPAEAITAPSCDASKLVHFTGAGLTLSDLYCDDFFRNANQAARRRGYGRGVFNDAGGAVAGILNLVKAGSNALTASSVGFAAIDSTFRNYESSFMVDPDLSKLRQLVLAAQDTMKGTIDTEPPKTLYGAESKVRRYAGLCSFLGMQGLLNEAMTRTTQQLVQQSTPPPAAVPVVAVPLGVPPAAVPIAPPVIPGPTPVMVPLISTRVPPG